MRTFVQRRRPAPAIGSQLGAHIARSRPVGPLPVQARETLSGLPGHTLEKIRIHDDAGAHAAAAGLAARAFTVGFAIYFARGAYQPETPAGLRVLAHEAAHAHQQARAAVPPADQLIIAPPASREEAQAHRFAGAVGRGARGEMPAPVPVGTVARVMRLTFEARPATPETVDLKDRINAGAGAMGGKPGFAFGGGGGPEMVLGGQTYEAEPFLFSWSGDVVVHGAQDEAFGEWEVGMLQRLRSYALNIQWGAGPGQTRCGGSFGNLRDSKYQESAWFDAGTTSEPFTADGDVRSTKIEDSPVANNIPYQNPAPGRDDTTGTFSYKASFITYLSAHHIPGGPEPASFKPLQSVRWALSLEGRFDGSTFPPSVEVTGGGATMAEGVVAGDEEKEKPITGGAIALDEINKIQQCWQRSGGE